MKKDLFSLIEERQPKLSKGHKLIANYILAHYDKAAFMTAQKLGKTVGVSESTVVRFASELGYDGYPALQRALQDLMRNRLTAVQRIEVTSDRMNRDDVLENYRKMARILGTDVSKMVLSHQTHTTNIRLVTGADAGKGIWRERDYENIDGLITNVPGLTLVTFFADCVDRKGVV